MAFGKRQLVLAALVVALGAAVYLNWQFSDNKNLLVTDTVASGKVLGEAQYVNENNSSVTASTTVSANAQPTGTNPESGISTTASEYFAQTQLTRQQARDKAVDTIKGILEDIQSSEAAKAEAVKQAADIANNIQQEANIESLIKAKGFADCAVFIQNGECSVAVATKGLLDSEAITIKDIVSGQSAISFEKIKIVEVK